MPKYIDIEDFSQMIYENFGRDEEFDYRDLIGILSEQPIADAKEVVRGEWEMNSEYPDTLICSECKHKYDVWFVDKGTNFCPECGADMRGESK